MTYIIICSYYIVYILSGAAELSFSILFQRRIICHNMIVENNFDPKLNYIKETA